MVNVPAVAPSDVDTNDPKITSGDAHIQHEELQYLNLIRHVMSNGTVKSDRTGTGTISYFGTQSRYSLADGVMPLLTTKKVFWKGIVEELLWFIRGSTDAKELSAKGVKIWEPNGSRKFLDELGFTHRDEGDLGPVYGFQWRHFGAKYIDHKTDYTGQGVDQLADVLFKIKNKPDDRRIMLCAWNVGDLDQMALPPCHCLVQFYVAQGKLSCQLYQRSGDIGLGVPFNIASYALLTHILAKAAGLQAGEFIHTIGDAHIYSNHIEPLKAQITRTPRPFPKVIIKKDTIDRLEDLKYEDFELIGYDPMDGIKMQMAV